ncbi:MAG: RNA-binding S4 domain-containing protein [Velocimicrobium sp.]
MDTLQIKDEFIKLGQAMKLANLVESGIDAKFAIHDGLVLVNGKTQLQRGKKLYDGDTFKFDNQEFKIKGK